MIHALRDTKPVDNSTARTPDRKTQYTSLLYSEMAARKHAEEQSRRSTLLLQAIGHAQLQSAAGIDLSTILSNLLAVLLNVTQARQVYLCERPAASKQCGQVQLELFNERKPSNGNYGHLAQLAGHILETSAPRLWFASGEAVAALRRPGILDTYYLGFPIVASNLTSRDAMSLISGDKATILGAIVLAGRATSFEPTVTDLLQPLLATIAQLLLAHDNEMRLRDAEKKLDDERALLTQRIADLTYANAELARAANAKDEFLATINHELRTPLNTVLLYAESLQAQLPGPLNERQLRAAGGIRESANHLLLLINDFLDVMKMDAGKLTLDIKTTAITEICESSLRLVAEMARKKELQVRCHLPAEMTSVNADERRLKQMLVNLLSNAIKFTPAGGSIGLEVSAHPEANELHFTVWDTGIGIAPEDTAKLFQPFVQLDSTPTCQHGGTGLGLFLVYRMAELHGGSVSVASEVGRGSRFTIALPWQPRHQQLPADTAILSDIIGASGQKEIESSATHQANSKRAGAYMNGIPAAPRVVSTFSGYPTVLLADDNEANLTVLSDLLVQWNCRVLKARTGIEALRQIHEEQPDLVLMDIQMPEMNGLEAIRQIRAEPQVGNIPIVALTALAMPGHREQCLTAGANEYLSKPLQIDRLTRIFSAYLNRAPQSPHQANLTSAA